MIKRLNRGPVRDPQPPWCATSDSDGGECTCKINITAYDKIKSCHDFIHLAQRSTYSSFFNSMNIGTRGQLCEKFHYTLPDLSMGNMQIFC